MSDGFDRGGRGDGGGRTERLGELARVLCGR